LRRIEMPLRPFNREQAWLLPPSLDELINTDHPARFVDMLLDGFDEGEWEALGIDLKGDPKGAPAYHPRALAGVWIFGFMDGVRSTRKLERACREQLPYAWLSCMQRPDHNTLWRFYKAHRHRMRSLLSLSVRMAVEMDLVDLAFQAVDGTKVQAMASRDRMLDEAGLERLLHRLDEAIEEMEEQNGAENEPPGARLPGTLAGKNILRQKTREALERVRGKSGTTPTPENNRGEPREERRGHSARASLTDPDARMLHVRGGYIAGYNAQAVVSPLVGGGGMFMTAADVASPGEGDHTQLLPMTTQAKANTGIPAHTTLADANYHSGLNLSQCAANNIDVLMPEANKPHQKNPYHKNHFTYRAEDDVYICPQGQELTYRKTQARPEKTYKEARCYRPKPPTCRACPAFGECTTSPLGRNIYITPYEDLLRDHRLKMEMPDSKELFKKRKQTVEPAFGILKEQMGARRFLLRGIENVSAEWSLLATAFNLRTLYRAWATTTPHRTEPAAG
jgi:transposase|tara:strand:+ start:86 stop:1609 length:1524 start_codon:yes stop_codon:yes gene_type:complete